MLIDTHAHLQDKVFNPDQAQVITRAKTAAVDYIINVGYDEVSSRQALELASQYEHIFAAIGVHPHDAASFTPAVAQSLRQMSAAGKVVAIGEIGLDYHRHLSPEKAQQEVFIAQLELAAELGLPVIVHNREATGAVLAVIKKIKGLKGVIHCYSGTLSQAEEFMGLGFLLGITGSVTFPQAKILAEVVRQVSLEYLLLETDCPYLAPQPRRGQRNEPGYLPYIAAAVATLKNLPAETVVKQTTENAARLFDLPLDGIK